MRASFKSFVKLTRKAWDKTIVLATAFVFSMSTLTTVAIAAPSGTPSPCSLPVSGAIASAPSNKNDGNPAPVAVPDDGAVQAGAEFNFTDNGDGTITDHNTGLMWENKTLDGDLHDKEKTFRWSGDGSQETIWDWLDDVNSENGTGFAGYNDWRIPNIKELQSIRNYGGGSAPAPFNAKESYYWSSTTVHHFDWAAWTVFMTGGGDMIIYDKAAQSFYAIAVRNVSPRSDCLPQTGQTKSYKVDKNDGIPHEVKIPDDGRIQAGRRMSYQDNRDGTITDKITGLTWEKKTNDGGLHDQDNAYHWSGNGSQETIWDWLDDVNGENYAGKNDWRIPNIKELISIMDYGESDPSIDKVFDKHCKDKPHHKASCTMPSKYWASTGPTFAQFSVSFVVRDSYSSHYFVRAVRGGQVADSPTMQQSVTSQATPSTQTTAVQTNATPTQLPVTGWTTPIPSNKNDGNPAPVSVSDDGTLQTGQPFSFTDNGDGTITDNVTGLMWEKKSNDGGLHDQDNMYRWSGDGSQETIWDWLDDLNSENETGFAGHNDWRIPNVKEVQSMIHFGRRAPSVDSAFNTNCSSGSTVITGSCTPFSWMWTGTSMEGWPDNAWMVGIGGVGHVYLGDKVQPLSVRAVRGGNDTLPATGQKKAYKADKNDSNKHAVSVPDDGKLRKGKPLNYTKNGNGTITDNVTGLIWEDKTTGGDLHDIDNLYAWSGNGSQETIWDWLEDVNTGNYAGHNDWRIPNLKELLSLVDYGRMHPAIDPVFTAAPSSHRTGTAISPATTWHVGYDFGWISREVIDLPLSVRAVRGGL